MFFSSKTKSIPLTDFIYAFVARSKKQVAYKRCYRNLARHLEAFHHATGLSISTDSFSEGTTEELIEYLKGVGLMLSSIDSILGKLAASLRRASKRGYSVDFGFENIHVEYEDPCTVYLTVPELEKINSLKGLSKEAQAVRDRFLVGCFTALRISDFKRLTVENNFSSDGRLIHIKTQKTGESVIIPVHHIIREILVRNDDVLPKMPSQQAFGKTIKRICRKAGICDSILWERTVGKKIVCKKLKKYEMVSSHTARRSGATNMYLAGIPTARIMLLTGHKTEQAFFRYIRISKSENAESLIHYDFFK